MRWGRADVHAAPVPRGNTDTCWQQPPRPPTVATRHAPRAPPRTHRRPTAAKSGSARSYASFAPPTMSTSSPDAACGVDPDTGASRYAMPRAANAAATSRAHEGELVDESMTSTPDSASAMTESEPRSITLLVALSSAMIDHTTLAPLTASAGEPHT